MTKFKTIYVLFLLLGFIQGPGFAQEIAATEPFKKGERILILAPHPDDEAIACSGVIQQAKKAGADIKIVYLTNGDNNEFAFIIYEKRLVFKKSAFIHMGEVRRQEAVNAMRLLGLQGANLVFLGYPDSGTFAIFSRYWRPGWSFQSLLTRSSSVPYKKDLSFGAPYIGESILNDLERIILAYKPARIFVSHPADTNPDHKALYLFMEVALTDLRKLIPPPKIYPYLVHCPAWPMPRHYHPELDLQPPDSFRDSQINWSEIKLSPQELERKHQVILCYKSQTESSAFYLLSFARKEELFGEYPTIELKKQASLQARAAEFFGFSQMFANARETSGILTGGNLIDRTGEVSYAIADNCLLIHVAKDKELIHRFNLVLYLFGYSKKIQFASMPKIRIVTKHEEFRIYDKDTLIEPTGTKITLGPEGLLLRIPLSILGNPYFVLSSVKAYGEKISLSATGFRKIVIK